MAIAEFSGERSRKLMRSCLITVGILLLIGLVLGAVFLNSRLGVGRADNRSTELAGVLTEGQARQLDKAADLYREYKRMRELETFREKARARLVQAVSILEVLSKERLNDRELAQRLEIMKTDLHTLEAEPELEKSRRLQSEAEALRTDNKHEAALPLVEAALEIQHKINEDYPLARQAGGSRLAILERLELELRAWPTYQASLQAEEAAQKALREKRWNAALENFQRAHETQLQINEEFPDLRLASITRSDQIEEEIKSFDALDLLVELEAHREQALQLLEAKKPLEAADRYQDAERVQLKINRDFAGSRFASRDRYQELVLAREEALSRELADGILVDYREIRQRVDGQQWDGLIPLVERLIPTVERFVEQNPRSQLVQREHLLELEFLKGSYEVLPNLVREIEARLIAQGELDWLAHEVRQSWYEALMGRNPSRNRAVEGPVDSLLLAEAEQFLLRLRWSTGWSVRLPSYEDYKLAYSVIEEGEAPSGLAQPEDVPAQPPRKLMHLRGNLSEWCLDHESSPWIVGSNYRDGLDILGGRAFRPIRGQSRDRTIGFRFVRERAR